MVHFQTIASYQQHFEYVRNNFANDVVFLDSEKHSVEELTNLAEIKIRHKLDNNWLKLTTDKLDVEAAQSFVTSAQDGAISIFLGTFTFF